MPPITDLFSVSIVLRFLKILFYWNHTMCSRVCVCVCLASFIWLNVSLRFIRIVAFISSLLFYIAEQYSIV